MRIKGLDGGCAETEKVLHSYVRGPAFPLTHPHGLNSQSQEVSDFAIPDMGVSHATSDEDLPLICWAPPLLRGVGAIAVCAPREHDDG